MSWLGWTITGAIALFLWELLGAWARRQQEIEDTERAAAEEAQRKQREERRAYLINRFGNEWIADRILEKKYWKGQSEDQLRESLGDPEDTDQRVLKKKTKETWKYYETGRNRYDLKIFLEDGEVVGWDAK